MESTGRIAAAFTPGIFTEPRGFIKVLEFVLSIFAFATTTSPESSTTFRVRCNATDDYTAITFSYSYSYDLEGVCFNLPCDGSPKKPFCLLGGSQSSAQFYVFVGVIVFLYCLGALVLYVFFDELYRRNTRIVIADFVISIVLTLFWIIASSAWAAGLNDVKTYTDPVDGSIFDNIGSGGAVCKPSSNKNCITDSNGNFATLNVSIIFGFLNFVVWVGNLWFLYKETPWFKVQAKPPTAPAKDVYVITNEPPQQQPPSQPTQPIPPTQ